MSPIGVQEFVSAVRKESKILERDEMAGHLVAPKRSLNVRSILERSANDPSDSHTKSRKASLRTVAPSVGPVQSTFHFVIEFFSFFVVFARIGTALMFMPVFGEVQNFGAATSLSSQMLYQPVRAAFDPRSQLLPERVSVNRSISCRHAEVLMDYGSGLRHVSSCHIAVCRIQVRAYRGLAQCL